MVVELVPMFGWSQRLNVGQAEESLTESALVFNKAAEKGSMW